MVAVVVLLPPVEVYKHSWTPSLSFIGVIRERVLGVDVVTGSPVELVFNVIYHDVGCVRISS